MANIQVTNRSVGTVGYALPEIRIERVFNPGETKACTVKELDTLWGKHGGAQLIMNELMVQDKEWCEKHWDVPIEYFWGADEVKKCLLEDSVELFAESLDFAPSGVLELIKHYAWKLPLADLNKIHIIAEKTGFDVQAAIKIMAAQAPKPAAKTKERKRLRTEE